MRLKLQRLGISDKNLLQHSEAVTGVSWLNAEEVLSIADDHQLLKWDVTNGKAQNVSITFTSTAVNFKTKFYSTSLQFSPKIDVNDNPGIFNRSNNLATIPTTEGKVLLMNNLGRIEKIINAHKGAVLAAKWSVDGSGFLSSGEDGAVKVWSKSGMLRSVLMQSGRAVYAVDWNVHATKVAFCVGEECFVKSLKAHSNPVKWKAHQGIILCLEWSSGSNIIATGGEDCRYRLWDEMGRSLYSSYEHNYPITTLAWNPIGELLVVGSYNLLRLCDKAGWSHSLEKPSTGSIYSIAWSSDGTQLVAGCADGVLLHAHVIEKRLIWDNLEAIQTKRKTVEVRDIVSEILHEKLETRDRIIKLQLGYGHLVVATTKQLYIFSIKTWNTPIIIDLKTSNLSAVGISLIMLCEKHFLLIENNANLAQIYNYEGRIQCQIKLNGSGGKQIVGTNNLALGESLSEGTIALANDVLVVLDRFQLSTIWFFDVQTGNSVGDAKFIHSCNIVQLAINQCGSISERRVAFVDSNSECFLVRINSYAAIQRAEKLGSQISDIIFNNVYNVLVGFRVKNLIIWPFPSIVFTDKNLLLNSMINLKETEGIGKSAFIIGFVGNTITVRRSDGCILAFYVPPFVSGLLQCVRMSKWDQAVKICRNAKEIYLWATLAGLSAACNNYNVSEICYGQLFETEKILFLREIRTETNTQLRVALMSLFNGNAREADFALVQSGQLFRAIMLNLALFNFDRALELALTSQTHLDTVLGYRLRYLEQTGRRENDPKFLKYLSQVEIDWPHICENIRQDRARYTNN